MKHQRNLVRCPICGEEAQITKRWTVNKYGKRYQYIIYIHGSKSHYVNQDSKIKKEIKKGELEGALMETINSQDFKLGSFTVKDMISLLSNRYPNLGYCSVKTNLDKLAQIGMVERRKEGRNLYYVNTVSKERLSFAITSISILLEDIKEDKMLRKHTFLLRILNNHSWPLYYMPFRVVGDTESTFEQLEFKAFDPSNSKSYSTILIEDNPMDKRILLKLHSPLLPSESKDIKLEYLLDEPKQVFGYSSATEMESFEFTLASNHDIKLSASITSMTRNTTSDLSENISSQADDKWRYVRKVSLRKVEPFSVVQFKWQID
ncbi:MAG: BlaI/MecI/CopY family transcriptional regulator [Thermoplasmata archaeon]